MILFRQKYPRWWFDWNLGLPHFGNLIGVYLTLMDDHYPSTDEQQAVHLDSPFPDAQRDLSRWMPLVKWFLALPHNLVLIVLYLAAAVVVIIAWFAILFTGRYPRSLRFRRGRYLLAQPGGGLLLPSGHRSVPRLSPVAIGREVAAANGLCRAAGTSGSGIMLGTAADGPSHMRFSAPPWGRGRWWLWVTVTGMCDLMVTRAEYTYLQEARRTNSVGLWISRGVLSGI